MTTPFQEQLQNVCHSPIPGDVSDSDYGYIPSLAAGVVFCVIFGLIMVVHTVQFIWTRYWWCSVFAIGALTEVLGWAARTWSSHCPYLLTPFLMQISTLIIAPTFFTAGVYILLGRLIGLLGRSSSIIGPRLYLYIFVTCDIISLVIQAVGGGMASIAVTQVNGNTKPGTDIMVSGILFQTASITIFFLCAIDFFRRVLRYRLLDSVQGSVTPLLLAMAFSIVLIYVRSIYRAIELLQGWSGYLITHEDYFIALDGSMMAPAVAIFMIIHPAWFMPKQKSVNEYDEIPMTAA